MNIAYVTIGRNIGSTPMSNDEWSQFKVSIDVACRATIGIPMVISGPGGQWHGESEESAVFIVFEPNMKWAETLKNHLRKDCVSFQQDAIALAFGDSELISADLSIVA